MAANEKLNSVLLKKYLLTYLLIISKNDIKL